MAPLRSFFRSAILLPTALISGTPLLAAEGPFRMEEKTIYILNTDDDPIEITVPLAMARVSKWKRSPKGFAAPAQPDQAQRHSGQRRWSLAPGRTAEIVLSDASPFYWLEFSRGKKKILCTFDHYEGRPRLVGEPGLATLSRVGEAYGFSFEEPEQAKQLLDPAAIKAAAADYRQAIGAESHRLTDRAAHTNPRPHEPAQPSGRPRIEGYAGVPSLAVLDSIQENPAPKKPAALVKPADSPVPAAPSTEAVARIQGMTDFYLELLGPL